MITKLTKLFEAIVEMDKVKYEIFNEQGYVGSIHYHHDAPVISVWLRGEDSEGCAEFKITGDTITHIDGREDPNAKKVVEIFLGLASREIEVTNIEQIKPGDVLKCGEDILVVTDQPTTSEEAPIRNVNTLEYINNFRIIGGYTKTYKI